MTTLHMDTLRVYENLKLSGMPELQAKAVIEGFKTAEIENVATKDDITGLKLEISEFRHDIMRWMIGLMIGQYGLIFGLYLKFWS